MDPYERTMHDSYGDPFTIRGYDGEVIMIDANPYSDSVVADLAFTPEQALKVARRLIRAAEAALATR